MGEVRIDARSGAFPSNAVFEDGSIVCIQNGSAPSRSRDLGAPASPFTAIAVDGQGQRVLTSDGAGALVLYDFVQQGYRRVQNMGLPATRIAFHTHDPGRALVALAGEGSVRVYDLDSGEVVATLAGHKQEVFSISQSPDGSTVLCASADVALLWGTDTWDRRRALSYPSGLTGAACAASVPLLALAFSNESVVVWDLVTYAVVAKLRLPVAEAGARLTSLSLAEDGSLAVAGAANGCVYVWDIPTGSLLRILDVPPPATGVAAVHCISASAAAAQAAALLSASTALSASRGTASMASSSAHGPSPPSIVLLDDVGRLFQLELGNNACTSVLELESPPASPMGLAASASAAGSTARWRAARAPDPPRLSAFALSQDARLAVVATDDGRWLAYDVPQARLHKLEVLLRAEAISARLDSLSNPASPAPGAPLESSTSSTAGSFSSLGGGVRGGGRQLPSHFPSPPPSPLSLPPPGSPWWSPPIPPRMPHPALPPPLPLASP